MQELLLSNEQLLQGSTALQEVVVLCEGLDKEEYGVVIDRVNKRVQSVVDMLVNSLQEATMTNDVFFNYNSRIISIASATCFNYFMFIYLSKRDGSLSDLYTYCIE
jgi:hypothetical protein